ncbi:MAG: UvrD-helicase domain-containing protein, partial [Phycisphaeraceae bacterium]|nr:UvrD-helicase domain-containing protein [Phycisphaeraceae bacterium]
MASDSAPSIADGNLLDGLTQPQQDAVTHVDGPLLVLAGPGSGKTRVITHRMAHLVLNVGIAPWNMLAITFTNKAAGEMRQRVAQVLTPRQADALTVATFHAFCARLLREHAEAVGLKPGFSIYDTGDQRQAAKRAITELEINTKNFSPAAVLGTISNAKNELMDPDSYETAAGDFYTRTVSRIYHRYQSILTEGNAVDFDDLLLKTVQLLKEHTAIRDQLRQRYQYLLVDEYQDTNHAQFVIAHALAAEHGNICVTGDPDQSIYGWRGANIGNILDFERHYPDARVIRLEQNYRSTGRILAVADALIQNNQRRKHKQLWTDNELGEPVQVVRLRDEHHEAQWLVDQFRQAHDELSIPWSGMACFYRVNSLSRVLEDEFRAANIPYQVARGTAFYDRKEIKDAIAYLRVIVNPVDEVNLLRIINTPTRGIGDKTLKAVQAEAVARDQTLWETLGQTGRL